MSARTTILLADDHVLLLEAFRRMLEPAFAVVGTAADGAALVEEALRLEPDLVVADVSMPRMNGLQLLAEVVKTAIIGSAALFQELHAATIDGAFTTSGEDVRRRALDSLLAAVGGDLLLEGVHALAEDEVLLGLPLAPRHAPGACAPQDAARQLDAEPSSPFAALARLRQR